MRDRLLWLTEKDIEPFIKEDPKPKLVGCQPMPTQTSPIFTLNWVKTKDEKEFKDGDGI